MLIIPLIKKTSYEPWRGKRPNISYFNSFGCECFILNTKDQLAKLDSKMDKGIFLGYFDTSKAYIVFNTRTLVVEESIHVKFNDGLTSDRELSDLKNDFANMQISPSIAPKENEVKKSDEILPQIEGSSDQQPQMKNLKYVHIIIHKIRSLEIILKESKLDHHSKILCLMHLCLN